VSLLAVLAGVLRVLLGTRGVLLALCVVIFAVVLGGSAMRFGGILVVLSRLIVLVFGHRITPVNFQVSDCQVIEEGLGSMKQGGPLNLPRVVWRGE
jgi:hypothetical protein